MPLRLPLGRKLTKSRTEDKVMYADALQLAADFKLNDWPVHFASLENALTSSVHFQRYICFALVLTPNFLPEFRFLRQKPF